MKILKLSKILKLVGMACFSIILGACGGSDGTSGTAGGTGTVTLGVTDTPVDIADKVVVEFTGVEFVSSDDSGTAAEGESASESTEITFDTPKSIDLLALQGGLRDTLLDGQEMPAGGYGQIRLKVNAAYDGVMDSYIEIAGAQHELRVPSGNQTGLKLIQTFDVPEGTTSDFTIDFDLRKSVVLAGSTGNYMLKPVLRLVETETAASISGTIDPNVAFVGETCSEGVDPVDSYAVYVYTGSAVTPDDYGSATEPVATSGVTLNETTMLYDYEVGFLEPGTYTVAATCQADQDTAEVDEPISFVGASDVPVTEGATAEKNFQ